MIIQAGRLEIVFLLCIAIYSPPSFMVVVGGYLASPKGNL